MNKIFILRIIHGLFALYFIFCLLYLYYAAIFGKLNILLLIAVVSLGIEGFTVFILNKGDCPLIHFQKKIGDTTPFFQLFFPPKLAKKAVPALAKIAWIGVGLLALRFLIMYLRIL